MALTKISGGILDPGINVAGIVTATGFDGPFIGGSDGINSGIVTCTGLDVNGNGDISGNLVIGGNLTANGDFTTLNTTLREVELLRVVEFLVVTILKLLVLTPLEFVKTL